MTTNKDRAAEVIEMSTRGIYGTQRMTKRNFAHIAEALADAGLLAPDLPEPDEDGMITGHTVNGLAVDVGVVRSSVWLNAPRVTVLTIDGARHLGKGLISGADHAEAFRHE